MKKIDLMRPYDEFTDFIGNIFDRNRSLHRTYSMIRIDVQEKEDQYIIRADLPGVAKDEIYVDLLDDGLVIKVAQKLEENQEEKTYVCKERSAIHAQRIIPLDNVVREEIDAALKDGVLTVRVPKNAEKETDSGIEIK